MRLLLVILVCLSVSATCFSREDSTVILNSTKQLHYLQAVQERASSIDKKITATTAKTLQKLQKRERKLYSKLFKKDSVAAKRIFSSSQETYQQLEADLTGNSVQKRLKEYLPGYDTLMSSVNFLEKGHKGDSTITQLLKGSKNAIGSVGSKIQIANEIKAKLKERKAYLQQQLGELGFTKELKKLNKEMYYYQQQISEYKSLLQDKSRLEKKALALLRESDLFKNFMKKNSMLAQLLKLPDNYGSPESLAGLQTTASVQATLNARFAGTGVNPQQQIQQQVSQAQAEINKLKNKVAKLGGNSSSDLDMPENFKPNSQKTKSFMKRLEYGTNLQTQRLNSYFPVTTDFALSVGYKLNDKSVVGIGASYKLGWGSGIQNMKLSSEGVGLRSYVDWKLKGGLWITGGYEQNYYQRFSDFRQIQDINLWRQSALLGLTKKVKVGKKKESKVQLLYDFFYTKDNVRTQPVVFRVGYGF